MQALAPKQFTHSSPKPISISSLEMAYFSNQPRSVQPLRMLNRAAIENIECGIGWKRYFQMIFITFYCGYR